MDTRYSIVLYARGLHLQPLPAVSSLLWLCFPFPRDMDLRVLLANEWWELMVELHS